jgi:hypothetical protein
MSLNLLLQHIQRPSNNQKISIIFGQKLELCLSCAHIHMATMRIKSGPNHEDDLVLVVPDWDSLGKAFRRPELSWFTGYTCGSALCAKLLINISLNSMWDYGRSDIRLQKTRTYDKVFRTDAQS